MSQIAQHLEDKFALFHELADALPDDIFDRHLGELKSNSIGEQLWCVVGTRESYARALEVGEFSGWACSLTASTADVIRPGLEASAELVQEQVTGDLGEEQQDLALQLLEHEAQHMGQLLRYLFGLELEIPDGWRSYFAL